MGVGTSVLAELLISVNDEASQTHHRFKLRFFVVCFAGGTVLAVGGVLTGALGLVIPGAAAALGSLPPIWVIATGRGNPWWVRSPLDRAGPAEGSATNSASGPSGIGASVSATRARRAKFGLVLAGSAGFVLTGVALVAVGVLRDRPDLVFVGAVGCVFFGACAWLALAVLRGKI
jgi:hypothetical protein